MKRILSAAFGLAALGMVAPAVAADFPAQPYGKVAPAMMPVAYDWSGFYLGINGGWGSSRKCWDAVTPGGAFIAAEGCHDATGGAAGAQAGYRLQSGGWVFGLEAQGDWSDLRGSNVSLFAPANTNRSRIATFGLFTGQVGYAFDAALFYVKGGAALTADRFDVWTGNVLAATGTSDNRFGGAVGAGIEFAVAPNWSVAAEYDHMFMGTGISTFTTPVGSLPFGADRIRQDVDLVTARINYRWGGPVIAKY